MTKGTVRDRVKVTLRDNTVVERVVNSEEKLDNGTIRGTIRVGGDTIVVERSKRGKKWNEVNFNVTSVDY